VMLAGNIGTGQHHEGLAYQIIFKPN